MYKSARKLSIAFSRPKPARHQIIHVIAASGAACAFENFAAAAVAAAMLAKGWVDMLVSAGRTGLPMAAVSVPQSN